MDRFGLADIVPGTAILDEQGEIVARTRSHKTLLISLDCSAGHQTGCRAGVHTRAHRTSEGPANGRPGIYARQLAAPKGRGFNP